MLGVIFGLAVVVGGVIGSGIMRAPGVVAKGVQDPLLMLAVWAVGGLAAMLAAMPLVEAGASVPKAGGTYAISYRAMGPTLGVLNGWLTILQYVASNAFIAVVFGEYAHRLHLAEGVPVGALASFLIVGVVFINWIGTRVSGASQSIGSAVKGAAFLVLVAILFAAPHTSGLFAPEPKGHAPASAITSVAALVMAIRVIYQTYAGWDGAIYFSEEVQNPEANVGRSTFWGIALVTGLYVLVNLAALHILPPSALAGSEFAVGDAAKIVMGPLADTFITAMGLFSLMAIVNLQVMAAPRVVFAMARDGEAPPFFAAVAKGGTPRRALILVAGASLIFAATGSYEAIVKIYSPWTIGAILMVCLSAIALRLREPNLARPYRMPLFPLPAIAAALVQTALLAIAVIDDPLDGVWSFVVALGPLPLYWLFRKRWRAEAGIAKTEA